MTTTKASATPATTDRAQATPASSASPQSIGLGQQLGNQNLLMLLRARALQAKLSVSDPRDVFEQEADRVADQVMRMPDREARVESRATPVVQRVEASAADVPAVDPTTEQAIHSLSGRGSALPDTVRAYMEPRFAADFSAVRVHDDAHAHELARSVSAQAFTVGANVVFGAGRYSPHTEGGKRLLAHELTHVVQQSSATRLEPSSYAVGQASSVVQRAVDPGANLSLAVSAPSSLATPPQFQDFIEKKNGPTLDELATGNVDVKALSASALKDAIPEIEQYLARQRTSSFKGVRLEKVLDSLYRRAGELNLRIAKAERAGLRGGGRGKAKVPHPDRLPRVLAQKASVAYANPREARAEYDLIMQWLALPDLERKDRRVLNLERANLEWILDSDQQRVAADRHAARVRAALAVKSDGNAAAALLSLARTIESIRKDPQDDRIYWLYYQGEALGLSAEQTADLRAKLSSQLDKAATQIFDGAAAELRRRDERARRNDDHWLRARVAEIFEGHAWDPIHDPVLENLQRFPRIWEDIKTLRRLVGEGRLVDAASLLPEIETLYKQIKQAVDAFVHGYEEGEARAITTLEITAAVAAAVAVGLAAAALAPMVAGYVGGVVGAEGLGLTGIAGAVVTTAGSAVGTGLLVGGGTAIVRGGVGFGVSLAMGGSLDDAWKVTREQAAQGFYEGLLAGAGGGAGAALGRAVGVGTSLGLQAARRAGSEAIVNGTITVADKLAHGKTLKEAIEAGTHAALLSVPGSLVGAGNLRRLIAGTMASAGNAYVSARLDDVPPELALQQAAVAVATHLAVSRLNHDSGAAVAKWSRRGTSHVNAVRSTARELTAAVIGHTESARPAIEQARPAELEAAEPSADRGRQGPTTKPLILTERELQHLAAEVLRRPVKDFEGKAHFYETQEAYEAEYRRKHPDSEPPRGYFEPRTGELHVSPLTDVNTAIHEAMHSVRHDVNQWGRRYVGGFLDEGVTDAVVRARPGGNVERSGYQKNIAFYRLLERTLGSDVVKLAILHGEYGALRARVRQLFGGSEARTFEFFNRLRSIGPKIENPAALDEAVAMLETASGKPAWQLSRTPAESAAASNSSNARIERAGPFSFLGVTQMRGDVMYRRVGALVRSGGPISDVDMRPFLEHMVADAKAAGATRLRLFPEFGDKPQVAELGLLAEAFGGTAESVGAIFKIEIPLDAAENSAGRIEASLRADASRSRGSVEASESENPSDGTVAEAIDPATEPTAPQASSLSRNVRIGNYIIDGTRKVVEGKHLKNGKVVSWKMWGFYHESGAPPKTLKDLRGVIDAMFADAEAAGASWLRIYATKVRDKHVLKIDRLAKRLGGAAHQISEDSSVMIVPVRGRNDAGTGGAPTPPASLPAEAPAPTAAAAPDSAVPEPLSDATRDTQPIPTVPGAAPPSPWSPEALYHVLEQGIDTSLSQPSTAEQANTVADVPPAGHFGSGPTTSLDAYSGPYQDAVSVAVGREVGLWYSMRSREYAVTIGDGGGVPSPKHVVPDEWHAPVHNHHINPDNPLRFRLPSPVDAAAAHRFWRQWRRVLPNQTLREFVEYNHPAGGRGRTELRIEPTADDTGQIVVRIHRDGKPPQTLGPFADVQAFREYWESRTIFDGSPALDERTPLPIIKQLERGFGRDLPHASAAGDIAHVHPPGVLERNLELSTGALRVYGSALRLAAGRDVTIWHSAQRGEYAVTIGDGDSIPRELREDDWVSIVRHAPAPRTGDVVAAAMPTEAEFRRLQARFGRATDQRSRVRAFVEFDHPDGGRGSIEYGVDPILDPDKPYYVRIHGPKGSAKPETFVDVAEYLKRRGG